MLMRASFGLLALLCMAVGAVALGVAYLPDQGAVQSAAKGLVAAGVVAAKLAGVADVSREAIQAALEGAVVRYGALPLGLVVGVAVLLRGRDRVVASDEPQDAPQRETEPEMKSSLVRKARKQAKAMARKGKNLDAAEFCFASGLMEEAAGYFIEAGEMVRAAEIRHDQNRFIESAELYLKADKPEPAARIFAQQDEHLRAAEAYQLAGNASVAAELYEQAGDHRRAAESYEHAGFPRHAAQAYVKCGEWEKAAVCLEQTILEETSGSLAAGPAGSAQIQKLVRMAGNLFERAGDNQRAEAVLARGEAHGAAAEIALANGREQQAVEHFLNAKDAPRAAEVMRRLGRNEDAARALAEHHRDIGDDEEAARCYEEAKEWLAAGDTYRMLEQYEKAAGCYEQFGDPGQAAEMYAMAGDTNRAAKSYESAGLFAEAAEHAGSDDETKRAELLDRAGKHLEAGQLHSSAGRDDDAIAALQQVPPDHTDFPAASAILGDIFLSRGKHTLAIKKLGHATQGAEITGDNVRVFYGLAAAHEANDEIGDAAELYERILAFDYGFLDVQQRLDASREKLDAQRALESETAGMSNTPTAQSGRYEIVGKLGRGGMGVVYKAMDTVLDRTVAYKVLPDALQENPQALKNFLREAKSAAKLNHPGIVTVFDAGEQDGVFYIAMEYVDGNTLKDIIKHRGKISAGGIVHVLSQMCEALAYAHEQKVVHRDIKTANAMWTRDRKAKIMDFGLAKVIEEVRNHTTVVSGTPYYMSPEQTLGKNVDHRTDIYSLGVSVFEMATGSLPFREGNLPYHHVHTPPPDPREFNAELPTVLANIIARCLEKDPDDRYQTCREIADELQAAIGSRPGKSTPQ
jgi:tetratricopeptide (TPR) repeat protein